MTDFQLPAGAVTRLHIVPASECPYIVCVARPPVEPTPAAIVARGCVSASMTHDIGVTRLDAKGASLAADVLAHGGGLLLCFGSMLDALTCKNRLTRGRP